MKNSIKNLNFWNELINSITHGIGFGFSITALVLLLMCSDCSLKEIVSYTVYGSSMVLLYMASTLYHSFSWTKFKTILNRIDHSAIYLLIAGTYTPFALIALRGGWSWSVFGVVWGMALVGITYKIFFYKETHKKVSTYLYLGMGWTFVIAAKPFFEALQLETLIWIFAGGLCYTVGTVFYLWKKLPFSHGIWHLFVLGGSACHFVAVYLFL